MYEDQKETQDKHSAKTNIIPFKTCFEEKEASLVTAKCHVIRDVGAA